MKQMKNITTADKDRQNQTIFWGLISYALWTFTQPEQLTKMRKANQFQ